MRTIRLGIVGLGRGFMLALPALVRDPRIVLAGAFDLREDARNRFAEKFGTRAYDTLEALLDAREIEAVYIATPHQLHAAQTIAALQAGKHVLVEKPMATNIADCRAMVAAAERAQRALLVGPSHGFDAPVQQAAELVTSGRYGPVRLVTALNFTDFMYRPRRAEELDDPVSGGVVYSQAAHQIDVVRRIVGQPVRSVRAITGNWDATRRSDGAYVALMTFDGGASASLTYSGYAHYDSDELLGWIGELGRPKDRERYGEARRNLAGLSPDGEAEAKLARTYGCAALDPPAPHHEHFGFVLVSCARADIRLTPTGIEVYGDDRRQFHPIAPPIVPRKEVFDTFVGAVLGNADRCHDGRWGLETLACCAAIVESNRRQIDVAPDTALPLTLESDLR